MVKGEGRGADPETFKGELSMLSVVSHWPLAGPKDSQHFRSIQNHFQDSCIDVYLYIIIYILYRCILVYNGKNQVENVFSVLVWT